MKSEACGPQKRQLTNLSTERRTVNLLKFGERYYANAERSQRMQNMIDTDLDYWVPMDSKINVRIVCKSCGEDVTGKSLLQHKDCATDSGSVLISIVTSLERVET